MRAGLPRYTACVDVGQVRHGAAPSAGGELNLTRQHDIFRNSGTTWCRGSCPARYRTRPPGYQGSLGVRGKGRVMEEKEEKEGCTV